MSLNFETLALGYSDDRRLVFSQAQPDDAGDCQDKLSLAPMPGADGASLPALAMTPYDGERALLAYAADADGAPFCQYLLIPYALLASTELPLGRLAGQMPASPGALPAPLLREKYWGELDAKLKTDSDVLLILLGALLDQAHLLIRHFPRDFAERVKLVSALRRLLPAPAAGNLRFATHDAVSSEGLHLLIGSNGGPGKIVFDWAGTATIQAPGAHPYVDLLRQLWAEDRDRFPRRIRELDALAGPPAKADLSAQLAIIAQRYALDQLASSDADIDSDAILQVLDGGASPSGAVRRRYLKCLLQNALRDRDAVAGRRVAEELEADPQLATELDALFADMLQTQPDSVYVFIRNRLNHLGIDEGWIPRLQSAARASLEVALEEGDAPTLISWLELIAHEPLRYQLQDILREGVLAAKERAHANGELGIHLILIAARRLPQIADDLYADESLISALPVKISRALRENSAAALEQLIDETAEYFLLALFHGLHTSEAQFVTVKSTRYLWALSGSDQRINLPVIYRPPAMIRDLATEASARLTDEALELHLTQVIKSDDRDLFVEAVEIIADRAALFPWLGTLLTEDSLEIDHALWVLNAASKLEKVSAADVIDAFFGLLDYYEWAAETQPMIEALTRLMGKSKSLHLTYRHLWRLYESCNALQIENAGRVAILHLLRQFAVDEDLSRVVDGIARVCNGNQWSQALQDSLNSWWRDYTHQGGLARLQRLEREMESQRRLEEQKQILRTALAMRRWIPQGNPGRFAEAINEACSLVEHISEAFDLAQPTDIDRATVRRELDEIGASLSADERHILANNLRQLAQVITQMAEKRSKRTLIRSDDSIERQLMRGEANPQGSIDMMKWIAGYLGGAHDMNGE